MQGIDDPVYFKRLCSDATIPMRATSKSAGFDLFSIEEIIVTGGEGNVLVSTGIAVALPSGTYGRIAMRSGLASKHDFAVSAGVIDEDYRGEIKVVVYITNIHKHYKISKGERFAQLIIEKINTSPGIEVEDLPVSEIQHIGFGSTGKYS